MERAAQGVSDAVSHLPSSDLVLEEGSWGPAWLARRGAIPLLWGLNARHNLNEEVCRSDFRVQLLPGFLRRPSAPRDDGDDGPDGQSAVWQWVTDRHHHRGAPGGFILLFAQVNHRC